MQWITVTGIYRKVHRACNANKRENTGVDQGSSKTVSGILMHKWRARKNYRYLYFGSFVSFQQVVHIHIQSLCQ